MAEVPAGGKFLCPARVTFAILGGMAMAIIYGLKVCMSVAIVSMINYTALADESNEGTRRELDPDPDQEDGPFVWDSQVQGLVLSSYFWGYFVSQIPGGYLSTHYSAKWVMFFSVAINIVCTGLTPTCAYIGYWPVIIMRIGEGIGGGVTFPGMHVMLTKWAPQQEQAQITSMVYAGTSLGTVASILFTGWIADLLGWEAVFYVFTALSCIWAVLWVIFAADSPTSQRYISQEERDFILTNAHGAHGAVSTPVCKILTNVPFLTILISHTCSNFGWYMVLIELPLFMKQILNFKLSENATINAIPYFTLWVFSLIISKILDGLIVKEKLSKTVSRKISTFIASGIPAVCISVIYVFGDQKYITIPMVFIGITCFGAMFSGFLGNHIDIAPNHAGNLVAITNTIATIPGIIVPVIVGSLTHENETMAAWRKVFLITLVALCIECITYTIWGSGEIQEFNALV